MHEKKTEVQQNFQPNPCSILRTLLLFLFIYTPRGPPSLLYNGYRIKQEGCGVDYPPPSSTEVKERVEVYLHSPSRPSWSVVG